MLNKGLFFLSILLIFSLILSGCDFISEVEDKISEVTDKPGQSPAQTTPLANTDLLVDKANAKLDSSGREIILKDGTKLSVPAGAVNGETNIELKSLQSPQDFGKGTMAYELSGATRVVKPITLTFNVTEGLNADEISIFRYDTATQKTADIPYTYDKANSSVTVTIDPAKMTFTPYKSISGSTASMVAAHILLGGIETSNQWIPDRLRILFTPTKAHVTKDSEHLIRTAYYEQVGGSCWATDTMMLLRSYQPGSERRNQGEVLYAGGVGIDDFGLGVIGLQTGLVDYLSRETGAAVEWRGFFDTTHMRWEILRQLDDNHPLIIRFPASGHYVLIVGYRNSGQELILQDSKAISPPSEEGGGMYCVRPYTWIQAQKGAITNAMQILWINSAVPSGASLQTVGCPGGSENGGCSFGKATFSMVNPANNRTVDLATLQFDPGNIKGFRWHQSLNEVKQVDSKATQFNFEASSWNAASTDAAATFKMEFFTFTEKLTSVTQDLRLPAAQFNVTAPVKIKQTIPLEKIRRPELGDANATQKVDIEVTLNQGTKILDTFTLEAVLSVTPQIRELSPNSAAPPESIEVIGSCFGQKQSPKSRVTVGGKNAGISSWSDTKLVITVPAGLSGSQPVVVFTGGTYEYTSNAVNLNVTAKAATGTWTLVKREELTKRNDIGWVNAIFAKTSATAMAGRSADNAAKYTGTWPEPPASLPGGQVWSGSVSLKDEGSKWDEEFYAAITFTATDLRGNGIPVYVPGSLTTILKAAGIVIKKTPGKYDEPNNPSFQWKMPGADDYSGTIIITATTEVGAGTNCQAIVKYTYELRK